ncbi:hypothetical protein DPMN_132585 [Dreissena polymorpha]|uniref:Reverse transcriptase domain-containing protein n=1 Tax=Dreissena polymorpha TaxID=45954 RepID=A0A9D4FU45_DREPO|nr:hypothetical protein DPMN_132585 [Dreissena polymorpha]
MGSSIGDIRSAASACADDICLCATSAAEAQALLNTLAEFANMERYLLHPNKSVHIKVSHKRSKASKDTCVMNNCELPTVQRATHLGIIRTDSLSANQRENVEENFKKGRRASYSLFGSGYRGHNGLNISTIVHLYLTYVTPVLLYGLELLLPTESMINKLETFHRKCVKEILQLPDNTANCAIYLITGLLPIQAQVDICVLSFLHNICSLDESSIEKQILIRQIHVKTIDSNSWVTEIRKILWKYELGSLEDIIEGMPSKFTWKTELYKAVNAYWSTKVNGSLKMHSILA